MEKKTKIIMTIIIVILVLIIAGLVGYIVLDKRDEINNEPNREDISSLNKNDKDDDEQTIEEIPSEEKARKLTKEELKEFEDYFNDFENNGFLVTEYAKPEEVDINYVLYSNSIAEDLSAEEMDEYSNMMGWASELDGPPTQCFKYKKEDINELLKNKMNISLDDLEIKLEYSYISKYDAYFDIHGDTIYMPVEVISGEINNEGLYIIKYTMNEEEKTVTMKKVEDNYLFVSNTK